jgi:hypothetical protein
MTSGPKGYRTEFELYDRDSCAFWRRLPGWDARRKAKARTLKLTI